MTPRTSLPVLRPRTAERPLAGAEPSPTDFPPGWYVVAEAREIPRRRPVGLTRFGRALVLFRTEEGAVAALDDRCRHRGAALSLGTVTGSRVACPFHGFEFDARGACTRVPVLGPDAKPPKALCTRAYEVREVDDWVWLWWGDLPAEVPEVPRFAHLHGGRHGYHTIAREWPASFARVIENQLDPFHLPFVHKSTIGRRMPEAMTVHFEETDTSIRAWTGAPRASSRDGFYIELRWANLWENHISDAFSIVAAFAPIDETHTRTYLRSYQSMVRVPGLRWLFDRVSALANDKVFSQDERVVVSQPQVPMLAEGEVLVKADGAIIAYRKMFERIASGRRAEDEAAHVEAARG